MFQKNKCKDDFPLIHSCLQLLFDFQVTMCSKLFPQHILSIEKSPPKSLFSINIDGVVSFKIECFGIRMVIKNCSGHLCVAIVVKVNLVLSPLKVELLAIKEVL